MTQAAAASAPTQSALAARLQEVPASSLELDELDGVSNDVEAHTAFLEVQAPASSPARRAECIEQLLRYGAARAIALQRRTRRAG